MDIIVLAISAASTDKYSTSSKLKRLSNAIIETLVDSMFPSVGIPFSLNAFNPPKAKICTQFLSLAIC